MAGESRDQTCAFLAEAATHAFGQLEPSIGSYGIRHDTGTATPD